MICEGPWRDSGGLDGSARRPPAAPPWKPGAKAGRLVGHWRPPIPDRSRELSKPFIILSALGLLAGSLGGLGSDEPAKDTPPDPAPGPGPLLAGVRTFELIPLIPWAETRPLAALDLPVPPAPPPSPPARVPSVLRDLWAQAAIKPAFNTRPLAGDADAALFESSYGAELKAVLKSAERDDDRLLAARLAEAAAALGEESGLRRFLLARALALSLGAPGGEEQLQAIAGRLRAALSPEVAADLTARLLMEEALQARLARLPPSEEAPRPRGEEAEEARLELARFQIQQGYLDEARETLGKLRDSHGKKSAEVQPLRQKLESRIALRDRLRQLLKEVESRPADGSRWGQLALFLLAHVHNEPLGAAAANHADHPALKAYGASAGARRARSPVAQAEKLVDLLPLAPPAERPGLVELALERIEDLLSGARGDETERLKGLRNRAESFLAPTAKAAGRGTTVVVAAKTAWMPTGVFLKKGRRYRITASGAWSFAGGGKSGTEVGPMGDPAQPVPPDGFPRGELVAQIGPSTKTIAVGPDLLLVAPENGELFLSLNERFREFDDNSGSLQVSIAVPPGAAGTAPPRPAELVGRWGSRAQKQNVRELRADGTCFMGGLTGSWVAQSGREAVLRWSNGAIERMAATGGQANLHGNGGRSYPLLREPQPGP
jgi:hypothetical protein